MARKLKLTAIQLQVLKKIKNREVKNIEVVVRIGRGRTPATDPRSGKDLKATRVNLTQKEANAFHSLERKGLISTFGKTPYYTNYKLTKKGKDQLK